MVAEKTLAWLGHEATPQVLYLALNREAYADHPPLSGLCLPGILQHPTSVISQREGLKPQAGLQPNPSGLCQDWPGHPVSASLAVSPQGGAVAPLVSVPRCATNPG